MLMSCDEDRMEEGEPALWKLLLTVTEDVQTNMTEEAVEGAV
jgi:hypothetical protein